MKTCFIADLPRSEPRGLQTENWKRKRGWVRPATQQRLQLQTVGLSEELLRVLRGGFHQPFLSNHRFKQNKKKTQKNDVYICSHVFFHLAKAKIMCSSICKCIGCKNFEESPERKTLMHLADAAEVRVQQQTAAKTKLSSQISDLLTRTTPVITSGAGRYGSTFLHTSRPNSRGSFSPPVVANGCLCLPPGYRIRLSQRRCWKRHASVYWNRPKRPNRLISRQ